MSTMQDVEVIEELSDQTWSVLERLARALRLKNADLQTTLDAIVSTAVDTVSGARYAGLKLVQRRQVLPQASVGQPPRVLDALQQQLGSGPCVDAAEQQVIVRIEDTAQERRWPEFARCASSLGVASVICLPLWIDEHCLGTLSLYAEETAAFTDHQVQLINLYATHSALALADAQRADQFGTALRNRDLIGQAKGILMERRRLTADEAFRCLSLASQAANRKLTVIAQHLVDTGELPGN